MVESGDHGKIKIQTESFIHENMGNIKDFYKISSCIGRGKSYSQVKGATVRVEWARWWLGDRHDKVELQAAKIDQWAEAMT